MPTRNINLTERYDRFIEEQINTGRFSNASEVARAGLLLLEKQFQFENDKLALLQALVVEGFQDIDQGNGIEINTPEELAEFMAQFGRKATASAASRSNEA